MQSFLFIACSHIFIHTHNHKPIMKKMKHAVTMIDKVYNLIVLRKWINFFSLIFVSFPKILMFFLTNKSVFFSEDTNWKTAFTPLPFFFKVLLIGIETNCVFSPPGALKSSVTTVLYVSVQRRIQCEQSDR